MSATACDTARSAAERQALVVRSSRCCDIGSLYSYGYSDCDTSRGEGKEDSGPVRYGENPVADKASRRAGCAVELAELCGLSGMTGAPTGGWHVAASDRFARADRGVLVAAGTRPIRGA